MPGQSAAIVADGSGFTLFEIHGDGITFHGLEVNGGGLRNCFLLGNGGESNAALAANDETFDHMRIHSCGDNDHEHAIYAEFTERLHITDSWLYSSGGFGLHFYPEANDSLVEYSVIDGNDTGTGWAGNITFSGESAGGEYTQNHQSDRNVITQSLVTFVSPGSNTQNVVSHWPSGPGVGNGVDRSCVYSPGDAETGGEGDFFMTDITRLDPLYANRGAGDYTLQPGSPCAGMGPR